MGLDQTLSKRTYVKNWEHMKPSELHKITVKKGTLTRKDIKPERISYITEEIIDWRKANAIHAWFVKNVQDGKDDCKEYYVSTEQLRELRDLCVKVTNASELVAGKIKNGRSYNVQHPNGIDNVQDGKFIKDPTVARELLPPQEGFFFGSYDYDEWYLEDIKRTAEELTKVLDEGEGEGSYYYSSSW